MTTTIGKLKVTAQFDYCHQGDTEIIDASGLTDQEVEAMIQRSLEACPTWVAVYQKEHKKIYFKEKVQCADGMANRSCTLYEYAQNN